MAKISGFSEVHAVMIPQLSFYVRPTVFNGFFIDNYSLWLLSCLFCCKIRFTYSYAAPQSKLCSGVAALEEKIVKNSVSAFRFSFLVFFFFFFLFMFPFKWCVLVASCQACVIIARIGSMRQIFYSMLTHIA